MVEGLIWMGWVEGEEVVWLEISCGITNIATTDRFKQAKSEDRKPGHFWMVTRLNGSMSGKQLRISRGL
jgi:hypothetical protein